MLLSGLSPRLRCIGRLRGRDFPYRAIHFLAGVTVGVQRLLFRRCAIGMPAMSLWGKKLPKRARLSVLACAVRSSTSRWGCGFRVLPHIGWFGLGMLYWCPPIR